MIADLKPYAEYKESGLPWLGKVPGHWGGLSVKQVFEIQLGKMLQNAPRTSDDSSVPYLKSQHVQWSGVRTNDLPRMWASPREIMRFGVRSGDLLVCEGGEGGRCAVLKSIPPGVIVQNALHRVRPKSNNDNRFLSHVMAVVSSVGWFDAINNKATIAHFTRDKFGTLGIPLPPPTEQAAIVRFLDWANGRLERAIRAKRKVIALLNEQKQAIIHRAVTRGLDLSVPLKPSGIPWLGDIPQHWEVVRSRRLFTARKELARPNDVQLSATQAYGVIPQDEFERRVGRRVVKISMHLDKRKHVERDDFVMSMRSFQGGLERAWAKGAIRSSYVILRPSDSVVVDFFTYVLKSRGYIGALQCTADFIRDGQDLTEANFREVDLPLPPRS